MKKNEKEGILLMEEDDGYRAGERFVPNLSHYKSMHLSLLQPYSYTTKLKNEN